MSAPSCVGTYEKGHVQCDGSTQDPRPCTWRDKCVALGVHCSTTGTDLETFIDPSTDEPRTGQRAFSEFCLQLTESLNVANGARQKPEQEQALEPVIQPINRKRKHKPQPRLKGTSSGYFAGKRTMTMELLEHFESRLMIEVPERTMAHGNQSVLPGQFYKVDRLHKSNYITFYCRMAQGWNVGLALVRVKPRTQTVDIILSVDSKRLAEALPKRLFKKLDCDSIKSGRFITRASKLDREGVGIIARAIGKLVENGTIELPKADG